MVPPMERNTTALPSFAPSPPLSASDHDHPGDKLRVISKGRYSSERPISVLPKRQQATDSSPCSSLTSATSAFAGAAVPSAISSFLSDKQDRRRSSSRTRRDDPPDDLDRALSLIRASWQGSLPPDEQDIERCALRIPPARFIELRDRLAESPRLLDHFDNDIRFDYDPDRATLVLRLMVSELHEYIKDSICSAILVQLLQISKNKKYGGSLRDLATSIKSLGHASVPLNTRNASVGKAQARKSPDGQYRFLVKTPGQKPHFENRPPFVIEVGYSQEAADLEALAQDYYELSNNQIKTVLTIDIDYSKPGDRQAATHGQAARFCLYRSQDRPHHNVVFRDAQGKAADGSLDLRLTDFVPDAVLNSLSRNLRQTAEKVTVQIPFEELCQFVEEAGYAQEAADEQGQLGSDIVQPSAKRVHWKTASPSPEGRNDDADSSDDREEMASPKVGRSRSTSRSKRRRIRSTSQDDRDYRARSTSIVTRRRRTRSMPSDSDGSS